ncbi:4F2 cell-surface antigen heavy chain-like [Neocloeon triangulifer]|uniref:4F2 cell-surface antigen heavy chain-like n=1 Tax=Neocloeon triangulifer TaxID=2078957 RepID=UPI00286EE4FC|nr:4F2 cell-surface antigen heavy chain-like [Neocloeon triangulifer]
MMNGSELVSAVEAATSLSSLALPTSDMAKSPSNSEFLGDEEARSTCPLLTPSPPAIANEQYTPENETTFSLIDDGNDEITHFQSPLEGAKFSAPRQSVQSEGSTSSGSSGREPTACVQLLGPHHNYQHIYMTSDGDSNGQLQENGAPVNLPLSFDHYSNVADYFFTTWNWPLIRQISSFFVVATLIAAFGVAVTMVATLQKDCDPEHTWWSSATVYEIFPASFKDSKYQDGVGDLNGVVSPESISYLKSLGIGAVRLNSIFQSHNYPEDYHNAESLTDVNQKLGSLEDVRTLAKKLHANNISLILDLPVHIVKYNSSAGPDYIDPVVNALEFWRSCDVDGFYLVGLDNETVQPHLRTRLQRWRRAVEKKHLFIAPPVLGVEDLIDLVHVSLDLNHGGSLRSSISGALQLWSQKILWSVGHSGHLRLVDRLKNNNNTVAALLLLMSLPGTPSILYGDEIGLRASQELDDHGDELQHLRQLPPMLWANSNQNRFADPNVLPWMPSGDALLKNTDAQRAQAAISKMAILRKYSPQLYMTNRTIGMPRGAKNFVIKYESNVTGVIAVQRWFQRRHKIVTIANLGYSAAAPDMSSYYYGGKVLIAYPHTHLQGQDIKMRRLPLQAGEVLVMQVDK